MSLQRTLALSRTAEYVIYRYDEIEYAHRRGLVRVPKRRKTNSHRAVISPDLLNTFTYVINYVFVSYGVQRARVHTGRAQPPTGPPLYRVTSHVTGIREHAAGPTALYAHGRVRHKSFAVRIGCTAGTCARAGKMTPSRLWETGA